MIDRRILEIIDSEYKRGKEVVEKLVGPEAARELRARAFPGEIIFEVDSCSIDVSPEDIERAAQLVYGEKPVEIRKRVYGSMVFYGIELREFKIGVTCIREARGCQAALYRKEGELKKMIVECKRDCYAGAEDVDKKEIVKFAAFLALAGFPPEYCRYGVSYWNAKL